MRTNKLVLAMLMALTMAGCESDPGGIGELSSELSLAPIAPGYSPEEVILGSIDRDRQAAIDLRALAARPLPQGASRADVTLHREITSFSAQQADELDALADLFEEALSSSVPMRDVNELTEVGEELQFKLQSTMDRVNKANVTASTIIKVFTDTLAKIAANMKG